MTACALNWTATFYVCIFFFLALAQSSEQEEKGLCVGKSWLIIFFGRFTLALVVVVVVEVAAGVGVAVV